mmetsp:Transcript_10966/g.26378  ORF Transcript_10966/g.26378 Transcript_10966/m.26378 type:complete len:116 (-) Transcript_10966:118-465(-)
MLSSEEMDEEHRRGVGRDRARLLEQQEQDIPMKPILMAVGFLITGVCLLSVWAAIMTGSIDTQYWWPGQGWKTPALSFFVLGLICFIPGSYTLWIAYNAWRGTHGYSFAQIPNVR